MEQNIAKIEDQRPVLRLIGTFLDLGNGELTIGRRGGGSCRAPLGLHLDRRRLLRGGVFGFAAKAEEFGKHGSIVFS
jgi:hypothetical protein